MSKFSRYMAVALVFAALVTGCGKQPAQEITDTKASVDAVFAEGGEKFAMNESKAINDELQAAMAEVQAQDEKFFKNYDKAKEMLAKVNADASKLRQEIPVRKEQMRTEAVAAQEAAQAKITEANELLGKAPMGKGSRADIEALKADVTGLEQSMAEVQEMIDKEDYKAAMDKSNAVSAQATEVSTQVTAAMEKVGKKK